MKTGQRVSDLAAFYLPQAAAFTNAALKHALNAKAKNALPLITALKEASIIDQNFEQASSFRNLERALGAASKRSTASAA